MDAKLHLANLLAQGHVIPDETYEIEVGCDSVLFYAEHERPREHRWGGRTMTRFISDIGFPNEQVAYDTYTIEFSDTEFTLEEFNQWLAENPGIVEKQAELQRVASGRLAELAEVINAALKEGEKLANEAGLPFVVNLGGEYQDVRKLAAIDWDSSSMYC